jgi:hypothetical protein
LRSNVPIEEDEEDEEDEQDDRHMEDHDMEVEDSPPAERMGDEVVDDFGAEDMEM